VVDDITFQVKRDTLGVRHGLRFSDWGFCQTYLRIEDVRAWQQPFFNANDQARNDASVKCGKQQCFSKAED